MGWKWSKTAFGFMERGERLSLRELESSLRTVQIMKQWVTEICFSQWLFSQAHISLCKTLWEGVTWPDFLWMQQSVVALLFSGYVLLLNPAFTDMLNCSSAKDRSTDLFGKSFWVFRLPWKMWTVMVWGNFWSLKIIPRGKKYSIL